MCNFETKISNIFIKTEFRLIPNKLSKHFTSIFKPVLHIFRKSGWNEWFYKLIAPIHEQTVSYFLKGGYFINEYKLLDVPKGVDQVSNTGILRAEYLVLGSVGIEIASSFPHVSCEGVQEGGWTDFG